MSERNLSFYIMVQLEQTGYPHTVDHPIEWSFTAAEAPVKLQSNREFIKISIAASKMCNIVW